MTRRRVDPANLPPVFLSVTPEARSAFGVFLLSSVPVRLQCAFNGETLTAEFHVETVDARGIVCLRQAGAVRVDK